MSAPNTLQPHNPTTLPPSPEGLILIDKPAGMSSHDVVDAVRKITKVKRVGHAGTLDPFATGLLLIGMNRGTKMLTNLVGLDKTYEATAKLGETSDTDDCTGKISQSVDKSISQSVLIDSSIDQNTDLRTHGPTDFQIPSLEQIEHSLNSFRGGYLQTAPVYSAKKVGGKKLYALARKGKIEGVEIPKKEVRISKLEITSYEWPNLSFTVSCSSGTYIRSLARDIGEALGCGAHLVELRRTRIGDFDISDAVPLADLNRETIERKILPYKREE